MSDAMQTAPAEPKPGERQVVVKKYANRRLYNTESSSYITLDNLADMVRKGRDFVVFDAKSGDDITRGVLTQIIVEEEGKGRAMLPTAFLRQLIGFYGDNLQTLVPKYLEQAMSSFAHQQDQMRRTMQQTMGSFFPFDMEEVTRQNRVMLERALSMFTPFYRASDSADPAGPAAPESPAGSPSPAELDALRAEVERLRGALQQALSAATSPPSASLVAESATAPGTPPVLKAVPTLAATPILDATGKPARRTEKAAKN
jgi:polyhydroxyalkanoate synthesis repressor PhaR